MDSIFGQLLGQFKPKHLKQDEDLKIKDYMKPDLIYVMQGKLKITFEPMISGEVENREDVIVSLGGYIDPMKLAEYCTGSDFQEEFTRSSSL